MILKRALCALLALALCVPPAFSATEIVSPLPVLRFVDSNGNALTGGNLCTFIAGTSTNQATFTDSTGNTPNTNPVVLNSRGEAAVWLTPGVAYKFALSTAADTLCASPFWTADNVTAPLSGGALVQMTGAAINETSATLASAATVNIGGAAANYIFISGTTTITAFDTVQSGTRRRLEFQGALTLTNSANIILQGGANITTAAGDVADAVSEGGGVWRVTFQKTTNWTNAVTDATNGGIGVTITSGSAALNIKPADLLTKTTPTTADSIVIQDAAASNAAKTATIPKVATAAGLFAGNTLSANPSNPAGTTSGTPVMMGIGSTCVITPAFSTRVLITVEGQIANNTGSTSSSVGLRFGTGSAPANAAAATGTSIVGAITGSSTAANAALPATLTGIATGLTIGTQIWIDVTLLANGGGTSSISSITCNATEI